MTVAKRRDLNGRALFAAVAPILERAHRERLAEMARERHVRLRALERLQHKERLVAHRELQYERACNRKGRSAVRYANARWRKLQQAYRELDEARQHAEQLGVVPARSVRSAS
jgi:hypothetical protein